MSEVNRRGLYKNNDRDFDSQRKNRNDHSVEIRKAKKEDQLLKRRNINIEDEPEVNEEQGTTQSNKDLTMSEIKRMLQSKDLNKMIEAARCSRKKLCKQKNPPINSFLKNGIIPLLVETMSSSSNDILIFESAWALTNIAAGESRYTTALVNSGAIPIFVKLMSHTSDQVAEQSIWGISNISGDSAQYSEMLMKNGIIPIVKNSVIRFWDKIETLRTICWFISNLFRYKFKNYPVDSVVDMLPIIREIMIKIDDKECNLNLAWAINYGCDSRDEVIDALIKMDMLRIFNGNLSKDLEVVLPSLRTLGNVVAGTNVQAGAAIEAGLVESLNLLIHHSNPRVVKETCWVVSNIGAGAPEQIAILIDSGLILSVLDVMKNGDYKSQKEATWVVSNVAMCSVDEHKYHLLNNNVFEAIVPMLSCDDVQTVNLLLDLIAELFKCVENIGQLNQCVEIFENIGGIEKIEDLQNHSSDQVYKKTYEILKQFLGGGEEDENEENEEVERYDF